MGGGSYTEKDWTTFSTSRAYDSVHTTTADVFRSRGLHEDLDPTKFDFRESVDGDDNPESTPVIIGLDVTGSMSPVLDKVARKGMKTICEEIYNRKPITDPHICALGIGDVECDFSPFQATQFEADVRIFEQLEKLYLEMGGGGNHYESYILAWYFAKFMTKTDSFSKRGRKGFIFTIGDEQITPKLGGDKLDRFLGVGQSDDYTAQQLLDLVYPEWHVFHIILKQGSHARHAFDAVNSSWVNLLGQNTIALEDYEALGETIVSLMEITAGRSVKDVTASWDGSTAVTVEKAVSHLTTIEESKELDAVL